MSTPPTFRRFTMSDFPAAPNWMENLFGPLNVFCEQTVNSLNKNLTIGQNVQGKKFTVTFTTTANYTTGDFLPIKFQYDSTNIPTCCILGNIAKTDGSKILTATSITNWSFNQNVSPAQVSIGYIAGLAASTKYVAQILVL